MESNPTLYNEQRATFMALSEKKVTDSSTGLVKHPALAPKKIRKRAPAAATETAVAVRSESKEEMRIPDDEAGATSRGKKRTRLCNVTKSVVTLKKAKIIPDDTD
jgi:hypothetical protein